MIYPEKSDPDLDQHFMRDEKTINKIVSLSNLNSNDTVLEIGAGVGSLTIPLAEKCKKVFAVEIDERLIPTLCQNIQDYKNIEVIIANALNMQYPKFNKIVSNLPFNICEPLLWKLTHMQFDSAIFTVPKKFYKLVKDGKTKMGVISNVFFNVKKLYDIDKKAFDPETRVESIVIRIELKKENFMQKVFAQFDKKVKNAILRSLTMTKRQARLFISKLGLGIILNKKIANLSSRETKKLYRVLNEEKRHIC